MAKNKGTFTDIVSKIIEEKGGADYKERWLRTWLSNPENEDKLMSSLLQKEIAQDIKNKGKVDKNAKEFYSVELPNEKL